jgi:hypothetical protein
MDIKPPNEVFYVWLVDLQIICAKKSLETLVPPNIVSCICFLVMKHRCTKNAFWNVNNKKCRKWFKFVTPFLFNHSYGLPVITMDTKCPNQVFYVWLVDLQTICAKYGLKCNSLQMMKFVNICSTWSMVLMKTRFETWLTRNDVSLFHLFYLLTFMAYLCSQRSPNFKSSILYLIGWCTDYLC